MSSRKKAQRRADRPLKSKPSPVMLHVRKLVRAHAASREATEAKAKKLEAAGETIISGGLAGGDKWEITNWTTLDPIDRGDDGGLNGYEEALKRLDPDGRWYHHDDIEREFPVEVSETNGLPPTLADALAQWVAADSTPYAEIAEVAEMSPGEVEKLIDDLREFRLIIPGARIA